MATTAVQDLVDAALDQARVAHPGVEFSITLSRANSLLLPLHDRRLHRVAEGGLGYVGGHVYRDALVWDVDMHDWLVVVTPVIGSSNAADEAATYYGHLETGTVTTTAAR